MRHTNTLQKKIPETKLEYVHKPELMIFNFTIVDIGLLQFLVFNSCYLHLLHTSET